MVLPFRYQTHEQYEDLYKFGEPTDRELVYWIVANETAVLDLVNNPSVSVVVYEELCRDPVTQVRKICSFLGIEYGEAIETFIKDSRAGHSDNFYGYLKDPSRVARKWIDELDQTLVVKVNDMLSGSMLAKYWN